MSVLAQGQREPSAVGQKQPHAHCSRSLTSSKYFTSLNLSSLVCKKGDTICYVQLVWNEKKVGNVQHLAHKSNSASVKYLYFH